MEIDQYLFKKAYNLFKKFTKNKDDPNIAQNAAGLESLKDRLLILACLLTGQSIKILPAESVGGFRGNIFFLPSTYSHSSKLQDNENYYIFRILYLSTQHKLAINWKDHNTYSFKESKQKAAESFNFIIQKIQEEYPNSTSLIENCINIEIQYQKSQSKNENNLSSLRTVRCRHWAD